MGKIHVLLSTLVLILIAAVAVRVDRNELDDLIAEIRPIVAAAAALETLGPDLAGLGREPLPPGVSGLPFLDVSLGGLKVWTVPRVDSDDALELRRSGSLSGVASIPSGQRLEEHLGWDRDDLLKLPAVAPIHRAAVAAAREVATVPWCEGASGLRAGSVGVIFDQYSLLVLVSNAWKTTDGCLTRIDPQAAADVKPIYTFAVAEREIERITEIRGVVGEHWGKRYLGLKAIWEAQRVQIPVLGVQVPAPRVYAVLGLTAMALLIWISHSARSLAEPGRPSPEDPRFSLSARRRPASRLDLPLWGLEIALILSFYATGLLAPMVIASFITELWLRLSLLALGSCLALSAGAKIGRALLAERRAA